MTQPGHIKYSVFVIITIITFNLEKTEHLYLLGSLWWQITQVEVSEVHLWLFHFYFGV